jgi:hypothetical protein
MRGTDLFRYYLLSGIDRRELTSDMDHPARLMISAEPMWLNQFLNSTQSGQVFLLGAMAVFGLPTWLPLFKRKSSRYTSYRNALVLAAMGQIIQGYFVAFNVDLTKSLLYASVGMPICLLGATYAWASFVDDKRGFGCLVTAIFTALVWLFLITVH